MAIFHADDVYLPNMIDKQIEMFKKNPTIGSVFTQGNIINENDEIIEEFKLPPEIKGSEPYTYFQLFDSILENGDFLLCPSAMIRSDLYKKLSPFRYPQFGSASDLDLWLRAAKCAPMVIINEKLMNYRISKSQGTNVLNRARTHEADFFRVMDFHRTKNQHHTISSDIIGRYELHRMEDRIFCALNFLKKHDFLDFHQHARNMEWGKFTRIILLKPRISVPLLIRGFFKLLNNIRQ